ncbi:MAG: Ig-like domain-containing protein, partial [Deltaproteobacteria bacterium]
MRRDASFPRVVLAVLAVPAALSILACTPSEPDDAPRVLTVVPEGDGVVPDLPGIQVRFSEPIDPSGVEDGRFVALATDADAKSVATAAGSDTGIPPGAAIVPARVVLDVGGLAAAVTPETPLLPLAGYAIVVGTGIRSVSGKAVLDPTGRKRAFATTFRTGPMPDRVPPAARWIAPPHGPVPQNLKEIRVGFSEPVTGTLKVNSVAGTPRAVAADILALALEGTLPIGPLAPALDAVHDAGGNRPPELPAIAVSACRDVSAPVIDPASFRVATTDTTLTVTAEWSELSRVAIEVAAEQSGEACGTVPEPPATLVGWGDFVPCPGSDPCGAVTRCPVTATATGLCPGRRVRVRLLAED